MCKCIQYKLPAEQKTKHLVYTGSTHLVIIQLVMMYYYTSTSFEKVLFCEPKLRDTGRVVAVYSSRGYSQRRSSYFYWIYSRKQ